MTVRLILAIALIAPAPSFAKAQPRACTRARPALIRAVDSVQASQRNTGLSVLVSHRGTTVLELFQGFADLEDSTRVSRATRFGIASLTKAFTGVALLKLVDEGRIDVDRTVESYVPAMSGKPAGPVTLRMLAAHVGGVRHWAAERGPTLYARHITDVDSILPLFASDTLVAPPATRYSYSSYGYNLLASAMQHGAGERYQDIVRTRVLEPLGLRATGFDDARAVMPFRARRYSYYDLETFAQLAAPVRVPEWDYSHNMAGGNMVGTAEELARFARAATRPGFLSGASLSALRTSPRIGASSSTMSFGWFIRPANDSLPLRLNINGSNAGLQAALFSYPDDDLVVVILANSWGIGSSSGDLVVGLPERLARHCLGPPVRR